MLYDIYYIYAMHDIHAMYSPCKVLMLKSTSCANDKLSLPETKIYLKICFMNYVNIKRLGCTIILPVYILSLKFCQLLIFQMGKSPKGKIDSENECCLVYNDYITKLI